MGNYVSIRDILERSDFGLLINMVNSEMSAKIFEQLYKHTYNCLLHADSLEAENRICEKLGLRRAKPQWEFGFDRVIRLAFLEEISSLKCYEIFLKDVFVKRKNDPEQVYESVTKNIRKDLSSFDYVNFLRYFFTLGSPRCIREATFRGICADVLGEMSPKQRDPFLLYMHCSLLLALMKFNFYCFRSHFLEDFVDRVLRIFKFTRDQKFMAVLSDVVHFIKDASERRLFSKLVEDTAKTILQFLKRFSKGDKGVRGLYRNSEFLLRQAPKAKGSSDQSAPTSSPAFSWRSRPF